MKMNADLKMSAIGDKSQEAFCKIAQILQTLQDNRFNRGCDKTVHQQIWLHIDDVNLKIKIDKFRPGRNTFHSIIGSTLLHITSYYHDITAFKGLLKRGADFTLKNNEGSTALHTAFSEVFFINRRDISKASENILNNKFINSVLTAHVEFDNSENPRCNDGLSHFHIACAANHLKSVQLFLSSGVCISESVQKNSLELSGYTPLHFAARFCGYATAKLLLEWGADVHAKDSKGLTPIHLVVQHKLQLIDLNNRLYRDEDSDAYYIIENEKIIRLFLENDTMMKDYSMGFCKLHAACALSDSTLAKSLVKDVDINHAINKDSPIWPGYTPLHFAALCNNVDTVKFMLENKADIKAKDVKGVTPFDICMQKYNLEDLHNILSAVPVLKDIFFSDNETKLIDFINSMRSQSAFYEFFQTAPKNIFLPNNCLIWPGFYLSHLAVLFPTYNRSKKLRSSTGDFRNVTECLSFDGNAVIQDVHGRTPIHLAFYERNNHMVNLFFEHQSTVTDIVDNEGLSHLHIACYTAKEDTIKILLSKGADVNRIYKGQKFMATSFTPIYLAVTKKNAGIVKILLEHGADANAVTANGITPIHRLITLPLTVDKEIGDLLFSSCNLKNIVTKKGLNHLHVACSIGNEFAVEGLLKLGVDPNAVCTYEDIPTCNLDSMAYHFQCTKRTPLDFAVKNQHTRIVELLLSYGADIFHQRSDGITLLDEVLCDTGKIFASGKLGGLSVARYFASKLSTDMTLQKRLEDDTGITLLHIACAVRNIDQIASLLTDSRVNVNAQVQSYLWNKATPLHLLITNEKVSKDLLNPVKQLLNYGANVTLMNSDQRTPLHCLSSRRQIYDRNYDVSLDILRLLITHHNDFSLNPINGEGVTHFHVACMACEYTIVENFLENGVDVNLRITNRDLVMTSQTPLHVVLQARLDGHSDTESQLRTIDVLLKFGADVNAQDENCSTPLLDAARKGPSRELFFEKLIKAGADINYTSLRGESVLEVLFKSTEPTNEEYSFLLKYGVNFNTFNPISGKGLLTIIHQAKHVKYLKQIMETRSVLLVDEAGRTPIHNIVANNEKVTSVDEYGDYIQMLIKMGYDIDAQDSDGKTALHTAAYFHNGKAVLSLLIAGADINIMDSNNKPAVTQDLQEPDYKPIFIRAGINIPIKMNFALHIITSQLCNLEVNSVNLQLVNSLPREKFIFHREQVSRELETAKMVTIGTGSITLTDFFSETGVVASRPSMTSEVDREALDNLVNVDMTKFPKLTGLIKLQQRKMLMRLSLMKPATESVQQLIGSIHGFSMPEICCRMVIRFLTNSEVKNLITSTAKKI